MRRLTTVLVAACCATGVAACGGDDDDGATDSGGAAAAVTSAAEPGLETDGGALTRTELVARADAVCAKAEKAGDALGRVDDIADPEQATTFLTGAVKIANEQLRGLQGLTPPRELADRYEQLVAKEEEATLLLQRTLRKAKARDASGLQDLQRLGPLSEEIKRISNGLGIKGCS